MDPLINTWSAGQQVESADLNAIQQNMQALRAASGTNSWSSVSGGTQGVAFQSESDIADATLLLIDDSIDWRDRIVSGLYLDHSASTYPGHANDYDFSSGTLYTFLFYTGTGALDAGGSAPINGNPPVQAAGKYAHPIFTNFWIYCDPTTGKLKLYNNSGGSKRTPTVFAYGTAVLGKR